MSAPTLTSGSLYEFQSSYTYNTGDLLETGVGSGIHLNRDVTFNFGFIDRTATPLYTANEVNSNPYIGLITIDILDISGNTIHPNYTSGYSLKSFTFSERNNVDVFGSYTENFGILIKANDVTTTNDFVAELYTLGNKPKLTSILANDGSGYYYFSGDLRTGAAVQTTGLGDPVTGYIDLQINFANNPRYTKLKYVEIYASDTITGVSGEVDFETLYKRVPIYQQAQKHTVRLNPVGLDFNTNHYFRIIPYSEIGAELNSGWLIGPLSITPETGIIDNPYLTGESDTLQTVTTRGNTTDTSIYLSGFVEASGFKVPGGTSSAYLKADGTTGAAVSANYYLTGGSFNTGNGNLTLKVDGASDVTIGFDGRYLTGHPDIVQGSNININQSNGTVIQDLTITLDANGHVTTSTAGTVNLDTRYYTESEIGVISGHLRTDINTNAADISGLEAQTGSYVLDSETGSFLTAHPDITPGTSITQDNASGIVIQDLSILLDSDGHVTGTSVATVDLDSRYATGASITLGSAYQIPYVNAGANDFDYDIAFAYNTGLQSLSVPVTITNRLITSTIAAIDIGNNTNRVNIYGAFQGIFLNDDTTFSGDITAEGSIFIEGLNSSTISDGVDGLTLSTNGTSITLDSSETYTTGNIIALNGVNVGIDTFVFEQATATSARIGYPGGQGLYVDVDDHVTASDNLYVGGSAFATGFVQASGFKRWGGTSSQFLKADGSIDSSTYLTTETPQTLSHTTGVISISAGNSVDLNPFFITTGETGAFYPTYNPSGYITSSALSPYATTAYVNSVSGNLQTSINTLQTATGSLNTRVGDIESSYVTDVKGIVGSVNVTGAGNISITTDGPNVVVSGAAAASTDTMSNLGAGTGIYANKVAGDFQLKSLVPGTDITISATSTEITINHSDTSSASSFSQNNSNGTVLQDLTISLDGRGHVTGLSGGNVNLDGRYYTETEINAKIANTGLWNQAYNWSPIDVSFNTGNGYLTLLRYDFSELSGSLDGRYALISDTGNFLTALEDDITPTLGGNLLTNGNWITIESGDGLYFADDGQYAAIYTFNNNLIIESRYDIGSTKDLILNPVDGSVGIRNTDPQEILDVSGYVKSNGYKTLGGTSSQFLKADGSVDSTTYLTGNPLSLSSVNRIPFMNAAGDDFDYDSALYYVSGSQALNVGKISTSSLYTSSINTLSIGNNGNRVNIYGAYLGIFLVNDTTFSGAIFAENNLSVAGDITASGDFTSEGSIFIEGINSNTITDDADGLNLSTDGSVITLEAPEIFSTGFFTAVNGIRVGVDQFTFEQAGSNARIGYPGGAGLYVDASDNVITSDDLTVSGNLFTSGYAQFGDYVEINATGAAGGKLYIGEIPASPSFGGLWMAKTRATATASNYAFLSDGSDTFFNAAAGNDIYFRISNATQAYLDSAGDFYFNNDIDVAGTSNISGDTYIKGDGSLPAAPTNNGFYLGKSPTDENRRLEIVSPSTGASYIDFGQPSSDFRGRFLYNNSTNSFNFYVNGSYSSSVILNSSVLDVNIGLNVDGTSTFQNNVSINGTTTITGHLSATTKAFVIPHPTKPKKKLQYACLEGPENGVYVRGTTSNNVIILPEYWSGLVDPESVTVQLTAMIEPQNLYVVSQDSSVVVVGGATNKYNYVVYGTRKDVPQLEVEI